MTGYHEPCQVVFLASKKNCIKRERQSAVDCLFLYKISERRKLFWQIEFKKLH